MLLRSGHRKPCKPPIRGKQFFKKKSLLKRSKTVSEKSGFSLRKTVKCYILTEDSRTVHFDLDEHGHHEICTKDSQSHEDIAWLSVFTSNESTVCGKTQVTQAETKLLQQSAKNLVILTQRSKLNEFVLLCKGEEQLSLKVLKARCSRPDYSKVKRCTLKTCKHDDPDFEQLSEDNLFFIMHCQGESVKFQCYDDKSYYLHVNEDSLDIRKPEEAEPDGDKNFYFKVSYL
ncbi:uncharacterized protein LOC112947584 [Nothoprocta perdicaria]|uniref:uncharacterized protein LOC112947584 n=1 Tax=Nothoprocta perdicaria TaxID=30464 RepID=UPI000E1BF0FF|nr:uncharacterized protein LOC112947584 [Nothoprocta perdicaria]